MFKDIDIFLQAATIILQGRDPYSIPNLEVFYPLPFYFLFIPFVGLPVPIAYALWSGIQALILIAVLRFRAVFVLLSMPILLTFLLGQSDILMLGLFTFLRTGVGGAGIALAFLVLKPQLVLLLAPWQLWHWLWHDRRQLVWFGIVLGVLVLASFVVQPDWIARMLARSGERTRAAISSSVWGLLAILPAAVWLPITALVVAGLVIWTWRTNDFDLITTAGLFASPFIFSYNLLPLFVLVRHRFMLIGLVLLSWFAFVASAVQLNDRTAALMTVLVLGVLLWQRRQCLIQNGDTRQ